MPFGCLVTGQLMMLTLTIWSGPPEQRPPAREAVARGFIYKTITLGGEEYAYCVYVPVDYSQERSYPLILFLHGSGERGDDGFKQIEVGLPRLIRTKRLRPRALIVMPQCRRGKSWSGEMAQLALRCVEKTAAEYRIDPERLYLTGLSLGGAGTWLLGSALSERFAALVPVCGFGDPGKAEKLAKIPTWVFHGADDDRVPVEKSREMVKAIRDAGGDIRYTEYPGVTHNCWDRAYSDPELFRWLFKQRTKQDQAAPTPGREPPP